VVYVFLLGSADPDLRLPLLLVSAGIGMVVGIIAVLLGALARRAWSSAVVGSLAGAALAYLAMILTFLPLFWGSLLGLGGVRTLDDEAPVYGTAMALTGALSGGCGSLLRAWISGKRSTGASGV
jgi:hypothetical protein